MEYESSRYYREKKDMLASREANTVKSNLDKLVHFLITQKNRSTTSGITSVSVRINQLDRTLVRERITITYNSHTGVISAVPEKLGEANFSKYTTDVLYKNQLDAIGADGTILPKTGKPQIFIRTRNYSGDLGSSYTFSHSAVTPLPTDNHDDLNYSLTNASANRTPQPSDNQWISPIRLFSNGTTVPVGERHVTHADRTFLNSLYEFNENYRNSDSLEADLFKLLGVPVLIGEREKKPSFIKKLIKVIRDALAKPGLKK